MSLSLRLRRPLLTQHHARAVPQVREKSVGGVCTRFYHTGARRTHTHTHTHRQAHATLDTSQPPTRSAHLSISLPLSLSLPSASLFLCLSLSLSFPSLLQSAAGVGRIRPPLVKHEQQLSKQDRLVRKGRFEGLCAPQGRFWTSACPEGLFSKMRVDGRRSPVLPGLFCLCSCS